MNDDVGDIDGIAVDAVTFDVRVPKFPDWFAGEEQGEDERDHVAAYEEDGSKDGVAEGAGGVEAEVEETNGDLGEGNSRDVEDYRCSYDLIENCLACF